MAFFKTSEVLNFQFRKIELILSKKTPPCKNTTIISLYYF